MMNNYENPLDGSVSDDDKKKKKQVVSDPNVLDLDTVGEEHDKNVLDLDAIGEYKPKKQVVKKTPTQKMVVQKQEQPKEIDYNQWEQNFLSMDEKSPDYASHKGWAEKNLDPKAFERLTKRKAKSWTEDDEKKYVHDYLISDSEERKNAYASSDPESLKRQQAIRNRDSKIAAPTLDSVLNSSEKTPQEKEEILKSWNVTQNEDGTYSDPKVGVVGNESASKLDDAGINVSAITSGQYVVDLTGDGTANEQFQRNVINQVLSGLTDDEEVKRSIIDYAQNKKGLNSFVAYSGAGDVPVLSSDHAKALGNTVEINGRMYTKFQDKDLEYQQLVLAANIAKKKFGSVDATKLEFTNQAINDYFKAKNQYVDEQVKKTEEQTKNNEELSLYDRFRNIYNGMVDSIIDPEGQGLNYTDSHELRKELGIPNYITDLDEVKKLQYINQFKQKTKLETAAMEAMRSRGSHVLRDVVASGLSALTMTSEVTGMTPIQVAAILDKSKLSVSDEIVAGNALQFAVPMAASVIHPAVGAATIVGMVEAQTRYSPKSTRNVMLGTTIATLGLSKIFTAPLAQSIAPRTATALTGLTNVGGSAAINYANIQSFIDPKTGEFLTGEFLAATAADIITFSADIPKAVRGAKFVPEHYSNLVMRNTDNGKVYMKGTTPDGLETWVKVSQKNFEEASTQADKSGKKLILAELNTLGIDAVLTSENPTVKQRIMKAAFGKVPTKVNTLDPKNFILDDEPVKVVNYDELPEGVRKAKPSEDRVWHVLSVLNDEVSVNIKNMQADTTFFQTIEGLKEAGFVTVADDGTVSLTSNGAKQFNTLNQGVEGIKKASDKMRDDLNLSEPKAEDDTTNTYLWNLETKLGDMGYTGDQIGGMKRNVREKVVTDEIPPDKFDQKKLELSLEVAAMPKTELPEELKSNPFVAKYAPDEQGAPISISPSELSGMGKNEKDAITYALAKGKLNVDESGQIVSGDYTIKYGGTRVNFGNTSESYVASNHFKLGERIANGFEDGKTKALVKTLEKLTGLSEAEVRAEASARYDEYRKQVADGAAKLKEYDTPNGEVFIKYPEPEIAEPVTETKGDVPESDVSDNTQIEEKSGQKTKQKPASDHGTKASDYEFGGLEEGEKVPTPDTIFVKDSKGRVIQLTKDKSGDIYSDESNTSGLKFITPESLEKLINDGELQLGRLKPAPTMAEEKASKIMSKPDQSDTHVWGEFERRDWKMEGAAREELWNGLKQKDIDAANPDKEVQGVAKVLFMNRDREEVTNLLKDTDQKTIDAAWQLVKDLGFDHRKNYSFGEFEKKYNAERYVDWSSLSDEEKSNMEKVVEFKGEKGSVEDYKNKSALMDLGRSIKFGDHKKTVELLKQLVPDYETNPAKMGEVYEKALKAVKNAEKPPVLGILAKALHKLLGNTDKDFRLSAEKYVRNEIAYLSRKGNVEVTPTLSVDMSNRAFDGNSKAFHVEVDPSSPAVLAVNDNVYQAISEHKGDTGAETSTSTGLAKRILNFVTKNSDKLTPNEKDKLIEVATNLNKTDEKGAIMFRIAPDSSPHELLAEARTHEYLHKKVIDKVGSIHLPEVMVRNIMDTPSGRKLMSMQTVGESGESLPSLANRVIHEALAYATDIDTVDRLAPMDVETMGAYADVYLNTLDEYARIYGDDAAKEISKLADPKLLKEFENYERNSKYNSNEGRPRVSEAEWQGSSKGKSDGKDALAIKEKDPRDVWQGSGVKRVTAERLTPTGEFDSYTGYASAEKRVRQGGKKTFNFFVAKEDGTFVREDAFENNKALKPFRFSGELNLMDMGREVQMSKDYNELSFARFQQKYEDQGYHGFFSSRDDLPDAYRYRMAVFDNEITRAILSGDQGTLSIKAKERFKDPDFQEWAYSDDYKPIVDDNGEPILLYHGTTLHSWMRAAEPSTYHTGYANLRNHNYEFISLATIPQTAESYTYSAGYDQISILPDGSTYTDLSKPVVYPLIARIKKLFDYRDSNVIKEFETWIDKNFAKKSIDWDDDAGEINLASKGGDFEIYREDWGTFTLENITYDRKFGGFPSLESAKRYADELLYSGEQLSVPKQYLLSGVEIGDYEYVENSATLRFMKENGYDAFTTKEGGLNYHVFNPAESLKSPFGNFSKDTTLGIKAPVKEGFYSPTEESFLTALDKGKLPKIANGEDWLNKIKSLEGAKKEEIEWMGLETYLEGRKGVTREEVQKIIRDNHVRVKTDFAGGAESPELVKAKDAYFSALVKHREIKSELAHSNSMEEKHAILGRLNIATQEVDEASRKLAYLESSEQKSHLRWEDYNLRLSGETSNEVEIAVYMPSLAIPKKLPEGYTLQKFATLYNENGDFIMSVLPDTKGGDGRLLTDIIIEANPDYTVKDGYRVFDNRDFPIGSQADTAEEAIRSFHSKRADVYPSPHAYPDNTVTTVRGNERQTVSGKQAFHIDEVQSDLHQRGKSGMYKSEEPKLLSEISDIEDTLKSEYGFEGVESGRIQPPKHFLSDEYIQKRNEIDELYSKRDELREEISKLEDLYYREDSEEKASMARGIGELYVKVSKITDEISKEERKLNRLNKHDLPEKVESLYSRYLELFDISEQERVPDAPFKETGWIDLAIKKALRYAVENGLKKLTWTTGKQQIDRYETTLRQNVNKIEYSPSENTAGKREFVDLTVTGTNDDTRVIRQVALKGSSKIRGQSVTLDALLGKQMADEIRANKKGVFEGEGLSIGGGVHKFVYDTAIPNFLKKYTKKWGGEIGEDFYTSLPDGYSLDVYKKQKDGSRRFGLFEDGEIVENFNSLEEVNDWLKGYTAEGEVHKVHSMDITPAMEESVQMGQSLFIKPKVREQAVERNRVIEPEEVRTNRLMNHYYSTKPEDANVVQTKAIVEKGFFSNLSAIRPDMTPEEGVAANARLKSELEGLGFKAVPAKGIYEGTSEDSFMVYYPDKESSRKVQLLANKYNQDSALHGFGGKYRIEFQDGSRVETDKVTFEDGKSTDKDGTYLKLKDGDVRYSMDFNWDEVQPAPDDYSLENASLGIKAREQFEGKTILTPEDLRRVHTGEIELSDGEGNIIDPNGLYAEDGKKVGTVSIDENGIEIGTLKSGKQIKLVNGEGKTGRKIEQNLGGSVKKTVEERVFKGNTKRHVLGATGAFQELMRKFVPVIKKPKDPKNTEQVNTYKQKVARVLIDHSKQVLHQYVAGGDINENSASWYAQSLSEFADRTSQTIKDAKLAVVKAHLWLQTAITSPNTGVKQNAEYAVNALGSLVRWYESGKLTLPEFQMNNDGTYKLSTSGENKGEPVKLGMAGLSIAKVNKLIEGYVPASSEEGKALLKIGVKAEKIDGKNYVFSETAKQMMDDYGALNGIINYLISPSIDPTRPIKAVDILGDKLGAFFGNLMGFTQLPTIDTWMNRYFMGLTGDALTIVRDSRGQIKKIIDNAASFKKEDGDMFRGVIQKATDEFNKETGKNLTPADAQAIIWTQIKELYNTMTKMESDNIDFATAISQIQSKLGEKFPAAESNPDLVKDASETKAPLVNKMVSDEEWAKYHGQMHYVEMDSNMTLAVKAAEGKSKKDLEAGTMDTRLAKGEFTAWIDEANRKIGESVLSRKEVDRIKALTDEGNINGLVDYTDSLTKMTVLELVAAVKRVNPLVGGRNLAKNTLGNATHQLAQEIARMPAFIADIAATSVNKAAGGENTERSVLAPSLISTGKALIQAVGVGIPEAVKFVIKGGSSGTFESPTMFRERSTGIAVLKPLELYTKYGFRLQEAADRPFKIFAEARALDEITKLRQKQMGKGTTFEEAQEALTIGDYDAAREVSLYMTFQNDNKLASKYYDAREALSPNTRAILDTQIPYVKTPLNVAARLLDFTGIYNAAKLANKVYKHGDWKATKTAMVEALDNPQDRALLSWGIGRGLVGWTSAYIGYALFMKGMLNPFYDEKDRKESAIQEAKGTSFGRVTVGDSSYDLTSLTPVSFFMLAGATYAAEHKKYLDKLDKAGTDPNKLAELQKEYPTMLSFGKIAKNYGKTVPVVSKVIDTVENSDNPVAFASSLIGANSFIPAFIGEIAKAKDGKERVVSYDSIGKNTADRVKSLIPTTQLTTKLGKAMRDTGVFGVAGAGDLLMGREDLPIKYDMLGRPIKSVNPINPLATKKIDSDPLISAIDKYGININSKINGTSEDKNTAKGQKGQFMEPVLRSVVENSDYTSASEKYQKAMLEDVVRYMNSEFKNNKLTDDEETYNIATIVKRNKVIDELLTNPEKFGTRYTLDDKALLTKAARAGISSVTVPQIVKDMNKEKDGLEKFIQYGFNKFMVNSTTPKVSAESLRDAFLKEPEKILAEWYISKKASEAYKEENQTKNNKELIYEMKQQGKTQKEINKVMAKRRKEAKDKLEKPTSITVNN